MQNLILNRLAPISNPKNEKPKSWYALFHFETNLIKQRFFLFFRPFWAVGKFLLSRSEVEKVACSEKKLFSLATRLPPRVPSFYIRTKSGLKNLVTTVHLVQCKTNFFNLLCLWGRNLHKLKNIYLGKPPLISKKINSFTLVSLVYTSLHSSTLVYNRPDLSNDSSTLVYICLDSSSDSSALVYIRLDSSRLV